MRDGDGVVCVALSSYLRRLQCFAVVRLLSVVACAVALSVERVCVGVCFLHCGVARFEADGNAAGLGDGGVSVVVTVRVGGQTPPLPLTAILR